MNDNLFNDTQTLEQDAGSLKYSFQNLAVTNACITPCFTLKGGNTALVR
jgi:hypothetical protein